MSFTHILVVILDNSHYLLYFLVPAMHPRFLMTLDENLKPLPVNVRVGQAVDVVGQAGRPKTITGWQTQSTPVLLAYGERAELESDEYTSLTHNLEGIAILKKVCCCTPDHHLYTAEANGPFRTPTLREINANNDIMYNVYVSFDRCKTKFIIDGS